MAQHMLPFHKSCRPHTAIYHPDEPTPSARAGRAQKEWLGCMLMVRIRERALIRMCYAEPRPRCMCLECRMELAGATPRLVAPLGVVVCDEMPAQDCSIVRVLDLQRYVSMPL